MALRQFASEHIEAFGIEPNVRKQQSAKKRGLNVRFIDLRTHESQYDVISLLYVYSHLPDGSVRNFVFVSVSLSEGGHHGTQTQRTYDCRRAAG